MRTDDEDGQFTVNFVPANFPRKPLPVINTVPGQKEFWRVLNASTNGVMTLQLFWTDHAALAYRRWFRLMAFLSIRRKP